MTNFTAGQTSSSFWDGTNWQERPLTTQSVENTTIFNTFSGNNANQLFQALDVALSGITPTASGAVPIEEVVNVSGMIQETLDTLSVITLASGSNSAFRFSFSCPARPLAPVHIRLACIPRGTSVSGNVKLNFDYNLFKDGDDSTVGGTYAFSSSVTQSLVSSDFERIKLINLQIPTADFNTAGTAPYIVSCRITRDITVAGNYPSNFSIANMYADNVPGGLIGTMAGYIGGNLPVTGDLQVGGRLVISGGIIPTSGTAPGVSGTMVFDDDFFYCCVATNLWKRNSLNTF